MTPNKEAARQQVSTTATHATNEAAPSSTPENPNAYPPPAGPASISLDEARRRTLAQLDPNAEPRVVTAGAITAGALAEEIDSAFTQWDAWYEPAKDSAGRWLYLVLVQQDVVETNGIDLFGNDAPAPANEPWRIRERSEWVAGIWDIESGERRALGLTYPRRPAEPGDTGGDPDRLRMRELDLPLVEATVTPIDRTPSGPGRAPFYPVRSVATSTVPPSDAGMPSAEPRPTFDPRTASQAQREALRAYPLLPGHRWTYRMHQWEMGLGCSTVVTETVTRLESLPADRLIARLDRRMAPNTKHCRAPWFDSPSDPSQGWILLDGRDIYRLPDMAAAEALLKSLDSPSPPTPSPGEGDSELLKASVERLQQLPFNDPWTHMPFPSWRRGSEVGQPWPSPSGVEPYRPWTWSVIDVRDVETSGITGKACAVADWGPNGRCCTRTFCHGLGFVLEHHAYGGSTWEQLIIELIDYEAGTD